MTLFFFEGKMLLVETVSKIWVSNFLCLQISDLALVGMVILYFDWQRPQAQHDAKRCLQKLKVTSHDGLPCRRKQLGSSVQHLQGGYLSMKSPTHSQFLLILPILSTNKVIIIDIFGVRKGVWLRERERKREREKQKKKEEKLRVLWRRNYPARKVLLYVELLAGSAFWAPMAGDLSHSPRYYLMLCPGPQSAALYNNKKRLAGVWGRYFTPAISHILKPQTWREFYVYIQEIM